MNQKAVKSSGKQIPPHVAENSTNLTLHFLVWVLLDGESVAEAVFQFFPCWKLDPTLPTMLFNSSNSDGNLMRHANIVPRCLSRDEQQPRKLISSQPHTNTVIVRWMAGFFLIKLWEFEVKVQHDWTPQEVKCFISKYVSHSSSLEWTVNKTSSLKLH